MPDPTVQQVCAQIRTAVQSGLWIGMTKEEIKAVFMAALLES